MVIEIVKANESLFFIKIKNVLNFYYESLLKLISVIYLITKILLKIYPSRATKQKYRNKNCKHIYT